MFLSHTLARLIVAAFLGGLIGLEREVNHKPAGLRTNLFICFGAALYTVLSLRISPNSPDRIAANIIPGIGFIGAGSILHSKGSVSGLTTAATMFVVASIGMAAGAGEYLPAMFATMVILISLHLLGWVETRFNLKSLMITYEVTGKHAEEVVSEVNRILDEERKIMESVQVGHLKDLSRVQFQCPGTRRDQLNIMRKLKESEIIQSVQAFKASSYE